MRRHQEHRLRLSTRTKVTETEHKLDSKLARTNANGQIDCIICKVTVKSATLWKVHVNSKLHKERLAKIKQIKSAFIGDMPQTTTKLPTPTTQAPKSATKTVETPKGAITVQQSAPQIVPKATPTPVSTEKATSANAVDTLLPEKFFDDPVKDAKIRNAEYKDPQADEWDRFQREIREASTVSVAIIAGEQMESAFDRDLDEINDQMKHWSRYMNMEARKGVLSVKKDHKSETHSSDENESDDEMATASEFSDWRSKSFL
ncbi:zinc finger protein 830 [Zeugodacus cucurbitae]|uniref:zinc finger protein 830 n=1 Tax=Zeugodacus cucurbitae TaxID=28588 RepID=UPI0005968AA4|nr:zinc finger protein 830 [Zeugodacus cucurbitae]